MMCTQVAKVQEMYTYNETLIKSVVVFICKCTPYTWQETKQLHAQFSAQK